VLATYFRPISSQSVDDFVVDSMTRRCGDALLANRPVQWEYAPWISLIAQILARKVMLESHFYLDNPDWLWYRSASWQSGLMLHVSQTQAAAARVPDQ
jgi:hypothetical protein